MYKAKGCFYISIKILALSANIEIINKKDWHKLSITNKIYNQNSLAIEI